MQITLKAARMNKQLTQRDAAAKIGVTSDTIGNWERGKSFPDAMQIKRIEEVYKVRYDDLIFYPIKRFERKTQMEEEVSGVKKEVEISLDSKTLDQAIEKANRLAELLREVQQMIDSLFGKEKSES